MKRESTPSRLNGYVKLVDASDKSLFTADADGFHVDGIKARQQYGRFDSAWAGGQAFGGNSWATFVRYPQPV